MTMETLVEALVKSGSALALWHGDEIEMLEGRGVKPLYRLFTSYPEKLRGAWIADKVVGKGAAALMIAGGVERVHALVVSRAALDLFAGSQVEVTFDAEVPHIINRSGTGFCPVETLCAPCATAGECVPLIARFVESLPTR